MGRAQDDIHDGGERIGFGCKMGKPGKKAGL
jgi:hypothetical protein